MRARLCGDALVGVELADAVIQHAVVLGLGVAFALLRDDVQELRAFQLADIAQGIDQHIQIVTVDGTDVVEAKFFEQRTGRPHALDMLLRALGEFQHRRHPFQHLFAAAPHRRIETTRHQFRQIIIQRANRARDRHVVVIENDQQIRIHRTRIVQRLERHATGHRAIADDGDAAVVFSGQLGCDRHAQRGGDGSAGMTGSKSVIEAFIAFGKAGDAVRHAQPAHRRAPAGQYLVRIGLVTDIPHQLVFRRVVDVMQRDGQLHRAEIGREMPAGLADRLDQEGTQFVRQFRQLRAFQFAQVVGTVDGFEQGIH